MIELHVEDAPSAVLQPDQAQVIRAVSPTIDAERTDEGALLTIHDIDGTKEITVYDGEQGDPGDPGQDGVSPTVTVASITGGHRITITDADGVKTVDVMDGADGNDGKGIASIAKTGTSGLVDTYTITYTDGTTSTFSVTNGQKGDSGDDGVTFTPTVSEAGVISWTNDGGKVNPQPVNIKGPQGPFPQEAYDAVMTAKEEAGESAQNAEQSAASASQAATAAAGSATEAAQSAEAAEQSEQRAEQMAETIQSALDAVAQETTAQTISGLVAQITALVRQIAEEGGSAGDLNGFSLARGAGNEVILSYVNPEDETDTGSAVLPTGTTQSEMLAVMREITNSLEIWAGGAE